MKSHLKPGMAVLFFIVLIFLSCRKDNQELPLSPILPQPNKLPFVNAGADAMIPLGCNKAALNGVAFDTNGSITTCLWTQLSGPNQSTIVSPNTPVTFLTNISLGTYRFILQVIDNRGATSADTTEITVVPDIQIQEITFTGLTWGFEPNDVPPDEPRLTIPKRPDLFCDTTRIREVAVRLENPSEWIPVTKTYGGNWYFYEIYWGSDLRVFTFDGWLYGTKASVRVRF